uniref:NADH-ubiquinone oxidoreductase chain 2 n=1 Tax=Taiwanofungus camphoratus TaxID=2696576 RepID=A0A4D6SU91_TAICA|nr:NADH dehydrogenase subunit 2 [Taiwanofungus camphoratus]QCG70009.1 NADH dehydrogenase subunit 2 [Taiwanofungus camphoratus]UKQ56090.1 NADH dehydrogenase subunit 2 [Taiwanofungus camphoratus]WRO45210.1 NADH dehydrogenase subunit 2 [Taiwanofungus sp. YW-2023a]
MIFLSILILIVAIALPSINKNISSILYLRISSIILIYAGALAFNALYIQSIGSGIGIYSGLFHVTLVSQFLDTFLFIIGSLILIAWPSINYSSISSFVLSSIEKVNTNIKDISQITSYRINYAGEYSLIVLFSTLGASLLLSSADLISMYLSIELQSFGLYILSTLYRDSESATSAGLKYFLIGGLASCLILLGAGLIYTFTGLTNFESIYSIISVSDSNNISQGLSLGLILVIVGFLLKIAAAPLHNWAPDVYDDSPTIVTIWLTIMPKISIIIFLLELHTQIGVIGNNLNLFSVIEIMRNVSFIETNQIINNLINENIINVLKNLLLISSLLSLIIGTIVGLAQSRIKRLLAYSTISHIGFILLALAINTEQSIDSLIFYIIQYSITNLDAFLIILAFGYIINNSMTKNLNLSSLFNKESEKDIRFISELKGQFFINPLLSLSLTICLFSMAGIPPLIGFFSKQFVLYSAIQSGYYFMAILGIVVSVISTSYYIKIIRVLHTEPTDKINSNSSGPSGHGEADLTNFHSFIISTLTLSILLFVLKPSILLNSTQLLSLSLFNF